jgi:ubiquinone/menaquinone biosynthesis C-methylase UbiE
MLDPEIEEYYLRSQESERLSAHEGELERVRTLDILARYLPPAPAEVYDIGGAAGVHAFALAEAGYRVHLIDPVARHLDQARDRESRDGIHLASISLGEARRLMIESMRADAVVLLGPLYHLQDRKDRMVALREAHRILKPGGVIFAAAISRFASLMDGFATGAFSDAAFREIVAEDLKSGKHRNPSGDISYFTAAYFHLPTELAAEVEEAGFEDIRLAAIEGPVWTGRRFRDAWSDPRQRESVLQFLRQIEAESSILGASAHFLAIGTATGNQAR